MDLNFLSMYICKSVLTIATNEEKKKCMRGEEREERNLFIAICFFKYFQFYYFVVNTIIYRGR